MPCAAGLGCLTLLAKVEDNLLSDISKEKNVEGLEKCVPAEGCFFFEKITALKFPPLINGPVFDRCCNELP